MLWLNFSRNWPEERIMTSEDDDAERGTSDKEESRNDG